MPHVRGELLGPREVTAADGDDLDVVGFRRAREQLAVDVRGREDAPFHRHRISFH